MSVRRGKQFIIFGFLIHIALSSDWDGWDCGFISLKRISKNKEKAIRFVFWRLAVWIGRLNK